jgi:N-acetylglutamate synthase-like GNAT family acetyltransferase
MLEKHLSIRVARLSDVPAMVELSCYTFIEGARHIVCSSDIILRGFKEWPEWQWIAVLNSKIVGFCSCKNNPDKLSAGINLIGVDPCTKGMGIGAKLLEALEAKAKAVGHKKVRAGTPFAKTFYEKYGYTVGQTMEKYLLRVTGRPKIANCSIALKSISLKDIPLIQKQIPSENQSFFLASIYKGIASNLAYVLCQKDDVVGLIFFRCAVQDIIDGLRFATPGLLILDYFYRSESLSANDFLQALLNVAQEKSVFEIGVAPAKDEELKKTLPEFGFEISHHVAFWTMYDMEKIF